MDRLRGNSLVRFIAGLFLHTAVLAVSLFLSYNTYKEYMRSVTGINPYTPELKAHIKGTFAASAAAFAIFYTLNALRHGLGSPNSEAGYFVILFFYLAAVNLINLNNGSEVLFVQNAMVLYFAAIMTLYHISKRSVLVPRIREFALRRPVILFLSAFLFLIMLCAGLTVAGKARLAESVSNAAYLCLLAGIAIDFVGFLKRGGFDEEKD